MPQNIFGVSTTEQTVTRAEFEGAKENSAPVSDPHAECINEILALLADARQLVEQEPKKSLVEYLEKILANNNNIVSAKNQAIMLLSLSKPGTTQFDSMIEVLTALLYNIINMIRQQVEEINDFERILNEEQLNSKKYAGILEKFKELKKKYPQVFSSQELVDDVNKCECIITKKLLVVEKMAETLEMLKESKIKYQNWVSPPSSEKSSPSSDSASIAVLAKHSCIISEPATGNSTSSATVGEEKPVEQLTTLTKQLQL